MFFEFSEDQKRSFTCEDFKLYLRNKNLEREKSRKAWRVDREKGGVISLKVRCPLSSVREGG